jgi:hypothetical protein
MITQTNTLPKIVEILGIITLLFEPLNLRADHLSSALLAVEKQFAARALKAEDQWDKMQLRLKEIWPAKGENLQSIERQQLLAEMCLESAYRYHVRATKIVQKADEGSKYFHLILNVSGLNPEKPKAEQSELFDLVYKYSHQGEFLACQVKELPRNWSLTFSSPGHVYVMTEEKDVFRFNLSNPFDSEILTLSEIQKRDLQPTAK